MKAITVYQPWASLLACGAKKYETRSWPTYYRGPIAIHAGKKPYNLGEIDFGLVRGFMGAAETALGIYEANNAPLGAVVATAELVECYEISADPEGPFLCVQWDGKNGDHELIVKGDEILFGDWQPGRFAWEFVNMKLLPKPIPARGRQGLWDWNEEVRP